MKNLLIKLQQLQEKTKAIKKDTTNPYFNSQYFDINSIIEMLQPILTELKLVLLQPITVLGEKQVIMTSLWDSESGENIEYICYLPENLDPQKMGSAITYFRRYSLQSLLFLQAEDDDGNSTQNISYQKPNPIPTQRTKTIQNPNVESPFIN